MEIKQKGLEGAFTDVWWGNKTRTWGGVGGWGGREGGGGGGGVIERSSSRNVGPVLLLVVPTPPSPDSNFLVPVRTTGLVAVGLRPQITIVTYHIYNCTATN